MREFRINKYLKLRLEGDDTVIYVNDKKFQQCKFLLLNIPIDEITSFDEIESVDEAAEKLDKSLGRIEQKDINIPPEVEFWGHCSNLQMWVENDYDTRLLHSNLAFPLLKKLTEAGDLVAKRVVKEEIAKRLESGHLPTIGYLSVEGFLSYLNEKEFILIFTILKRKHKIYNLIEELIEKGLDRDTKHGKSYFLMKIKDTMPEYFKKLTKELLVKASSSVVEYIIDRGFVNFLSEEELWSFLINQEELIAIKELEKNIGKKINLCGNLNYTYEALRGFKVEKTHITGLALEVCSLRNIPELISKLKDLKELNLEGNYISDLSKSMDILKNLKKLEILKLNHNRLETLPESMGDLISLKVLDLTDNILIELPESIENLIFIEILFLDGNKLRRIPESVYNLDSLHQISLRRNKFVPIIPTLKKKFKNKNIIIIK